MLGMIRAVPWLLAALGMAIPLVGSGFALWLPITLWCVALAAAFVLSRRIASNHEFRVAVAITFLPVLFLLGWEGGWWLIPADLAWLLIELRTRGDEAALANGARS